MIWVHNVCLYAYVKQALTVAVILLAFLWINNVFCVYTEVMPQDDIVTFE